MNPDNDHHAEDASGHDAVEPGILADELAPTGIIEPGQRVPRYGIAALVVFVVLVVLGYVASAVYPEWVLDRPLGLIALSARMRNLLGALASGVGLPAFVVIGGLRLAMAYVTCHLIGRAFGDRIYYLFGRYLGATRESIDAVNSMFDRVEWLVVPWFVGSNLIAAITGVRQMRWRRLAALVGVGIVIRLLLLIVVAKLFERQLDTVLGWIAQYQRPLLIASVVLVGITIAINLRKGKNFDM